ncbi:EpsG family protein [Porphyromonas somerae]|uniref:EpsG family protein n=1 Tax=Porphyromonas somerae TaxID=322095 RepID=UPI000339DAFD|nr:EpsG family protein [Porphyromonas somerae]CCY09451.1 capsular polysaccharide biosynthesis protein [Porphyromonas sp. CAG:1061]
MYIYILLYLVLAFFGYIKSPKSNFAYYFISICLAFILGFRAIHVGVDTRAYNTYYGYASYNVGHMEPGWNTFIYLSKLIGLSSYGFNFLVALITILLIAITINHYAKGNYRYLGLFFLVSMGFYLIMFNGMRQTLGIAICFYAFSLIDKGKKIVPVLIIILACTIHSSCVVTLAALFVKRMRDLELSFVVHSLIIAMTIGLIASEDFFAFIAGSYSYDVLKEGSFNQNPILYFCTMVLLSNLFFIFIFVNTPKFLHNNLWFKLYFVSMIIQSLLFQLTYGQRIVYFYSISSLILFPLIVYHSKKRKLVSLACYLLATAFFLRFILQEVPGADGSLLPYVLNFEPF